MLNAPSRMAHRTSSDRSIKMKAIVLVLILGTIITSTAVAAGVSCYYHCANCPVVSNSSTLQENSSVPQENMTIPQIIAKESEILQDLRCRSKPVGVLVVSLIKRRDDLSDKKILNPVVTARRCVSLCSICEEPGYVCVAVPGAVTWKKFPVTYEEHGEIHAQWREVMEEVECRLEKKRS